MFFAVLIGYSNYHISREWSRSQHRWDIIDRIAKTGFFDSLPDNAVLYTEELHRTSWVAYDVAKNSYELESYINRRAGRVFRYAVDSLSLSRFDAGEHFYYLHAVETKKGCELLVSLSPVDSLPCRDSIRVVACQSDVFYLSPCKNYTLFYQQADTWKAVPFNATSRNQRLTHSHINDTAINPKTNVISNMVY